MNPNFNALKGEAKKQVKNIAKKVMKKILVTVFPWLMGIIIIAGGFFVIQEKIKDAADNVVKAASNVTSAFDNTSDSPVITVSDDLIQQVKKEMMDDSIDIEESYLTDALLKTSLSAYYATSYPYIDGIDYGDENNENFSNIVKGCIYLKRGNEDMSYINYNNFSSKIGSGKSISDRDNIKNSFSVDNEGNIVIATWSMSNTVTETINEDNTYDQEGSETSASYDITEYKIDQKTLTEQYAMSYKFPILLANMYSNEGFGIAVAKLGTNSKIVLTVLDSTIENTTVSKEYMKLNYKVNGTYNWRNSDEDDLKTSNFSEMYWEEDHTQENNLYKIVTNETETNQVTVKPTSVETWSVKGDVSDINSNESTNNESNETELENDSDYKEDTSKSIPDNVIENVKNNIVNERKSGEEGPMTSNSIEAVNAKVFKKMTDHKMKTDTTTKEITYTSSDMELKDNTDEFLALIKADSNGNYDQNGSLVKYLVKGAIVNNTVSAVGVGNGNSSTSNGTSNSGGSSSSSNGNGYSKVYKVNGKEYKEFKQSQGSYASVPYSGGTISSSGCGPTSVAIVASGYGKNYTPGTLVEDAKKKYNVSNFTASPNATAKMLNTAGLSYTSTYSLTKENLKNHLKTGKPAVLSVDNSCGGMFTSATHYIAILDIDENGKKVYVANPSNKASGWINIDNVITCNSSSSRIAFLITS